jgi:hypothetical protein
MTSCMSGDYSSKFDPPISGMSKGWILVMELPWSHLLVQRCATESLRATDGKKSFQDLPNCQFPNSIQQWFDIHFARSIWPLSLSCVQSCQVFCYCAKGISRSSSLVIAPLAAVVLAEVGRG